MAVRLMLNEVTRSEVKDMMKAILLLVACTCLPAASQSSDGSENKGSQTSGQITITKVEFVSEYSMVGANARTKPGGVIAVVQTNRKMARPSGQLERDFAWAKLSNYVFQYTTSDSKTATATALAVGNQDELPSGSRMQVWVHAKQGSSGQQSMLGFGGKFVTVDGEVISGMVAPSQYITGLTVLAPFPDNVTSFTLTFKEAGFVTAPIKRDVKTSPSRK